MRRDERDVATRSAPGSASSSSWSGACSRWCGSCRCPSRVPARPPPAARSSCPRTGRIQNYRDILGFGSVTPGQENTNNDFLDALRNSFGIAAISTFLSVIFATLAAYAIARLEFKGKRLVLSLALAIAMFPVVALVGPLFDLWRTLRPVQHLAGADHPLHVVHAAAGDLDAVGVLPRDPVGDGAGGPGGRRDVVAGVPQGDRAAGGARASSRPRS